MAVKTGVRKTGLAVAGPPQVFYRINSLLYTLRAIAQREDQLCMLMHHLRTSGKLNATLSAELREILEEIPADEYMHDLEALRGALASADGNQQGVSSPRARTASKRRAA